MPERVFSEGLSLPDGRSVRVLSYDDGSIRFRVSDPPYHVAEAFISGADGHAIVKLVPAGLVAGEVEAAEYPCPHDGCTTVARSFKGLRRHVDYFHSTEAIAKLLGVDLEALMAEEGDEENQAS